MKHSDTLRWLLTAVLVTQGMLPGVAAQTGAPELFYAEAFWYPAPLGEKSSLIVSVAALDNDVSFYWKGNHHKEATDYEPAFVTSKAAMTDTLFVLGANPDASNSILEEWRIALVGEGDAMQVSKQRLVIPASEMSAFRSSTSMIYHAFARQLWLIGESHELRIYSIDKQRTVQIVHSMSLAEEKSVLLGAVVAENGEFLVSAFDFKQWELPYGPDDRNHPFLVLIDADKDGVIDEKWNANNETYLERFPELDQYQYSAPPD